MYLKHVCGRDLFQTSWSVLSVLALRYIAYYMPIVGHPHSICLKKRVNAHITHIRRVRVQMETHVSLSILCDLYLWHFDILLLCKKHGMAI